jgi:hypothetical protein
MDLLGEEFPEIGWLAFEDRIKGFAVGFYPQEHIGAGGNHIGHRLQQFRYDRRPAESQRAELTNVSPRCRRFHRLFSLKSTVYSPWP